MAVKVAPSVPARYLSDHILKVFLRRYKNILVKWDGLRKYRSAVNMDIWLEKNPERACGAVGCLAGWTKMFTKHPAVTYLGKNQLALHFRSMGNFDATEHFVGLFNGRSREDVSNWREGRDRITNAITFIEEEVR